MCTSQSKRLTREQLIWLSMKWSNKACKDRSSTILKHFARSKPEAKTVFF